MTVNREKAAAKVKAEEPSLDRRYGKIGISAVAAALRYQSELRNAAYAPSVLRTKNWGTDGLAA